VRLRWLPFGYTKRNTSVVTLRETRRTSHQKANRRDATKPDWPDSDLSLLAVLKETELRSRDIHERIKYDKSREISFVKLAFSEDNRSLWSIPDPQCVCVWVLCVLSDTNNWTTVGVNGFQLKYLLTVMTSSVDSW
jgi:hypothetical protein